MTEKLNIVLNKIWSVGEDDLQWILRKHSSGFRFCRTKKALIRDIKENCGEVDHEGFLQVQALPDWHEN